MGNLPFEKFERKVLIKLKDETSPKFGKRPEERSVKELIERGIVNIDKPSGPSSHQVSAYVKHLFKVGKTGHSGTLDPKVTGCLPIAVDKGTRIVQSLLTAGKEYVCLMHLHKEVSKDEVLEVFKQFTGKIKQLPPVKSAVKRQWRFRNVYYIELLDIQGQEVLFRAGTEAGTYIRKLVHDIGQKLKTGAHMAELRRTKAGPFSEDTLVTLQELSDAMYYYKQGDETLIKQYVKPIEYGASHLRKIWVFDTAVNALCHGQTLKVPGISKIESNIKEGENVGVYTLKDELILVGTGQMTTKDIMTKKRGIAVKSSQVFMPDNIYPRLE